MKPILPDLLTFEDGGPVSRGAWDRRRKELYAAIVPHEYGGLPPACESVETVLMCNHLLYPERKVTYRTYLVLCRLDAGEIAFELSLYIPSGDGPFPVVLDGDGCWRYFNDRVVQTVCGRGYIAGSFNRTALAADNKDRFRDTGLYRLFPDAEFGALAAWAWGYHRCVDALSRFEFVRADQIAITGHSRGGKTVLLAGATDDRIAVTNPNCSGCGGSGLNRLKAEGAEVIEDFNRSGNIFWFGSGYADYAGRDKEIPYDQHFLHALTAPRGLLVTEAYGDAWANPPGSYQACRAAEKVHEMLGKSDQIGWSIREGEHAHTETDFETLLDFLDVRFRGKEVARSFKREHFPDIDTILT
jgi:hypothetical protein